MSVKDLQKYADLANGTASSPTRPQNSRSNTKPTFGNPTQKDEDSSTTRVPQDSGDNSYSSRALRSGNAPGRPVSGGASGSKSGPEKVGDRSGNKPLISGTEAN